MGTGSPEMILNDTQITALARKGLIRPFVRRLVRRTGADHPVLSFGLSSFGYDLRLSPKEFHIFRHVPGTVLDPKAISPRNLELAPIHRDAHGKYFILPARSYGLGVAVERLQMPDHLTAICVGKSTYARCGIIANVTPVPLRAANSCPSAPNILSAAIEVTPVTVLSIAAIRMLRPLLCSVRHRWEIHPAEIAKNNESAPK